MKILSGARAHLWQRISAVFLFFYMPFILVYLLNSSFNSYAEFQNSLLNPAFMLPTLTAFLLMMIHIWIGLRDVILDYIPRPFVITALTVFAVIWVFVILDVLFLIFSLIPSTP